MPRAIYPSDITREQFEVIRPQLDNFKKTTKPRALDVYDVFCAIVYVMKSCCPWRMLPSNYPKWGRSILISGNGIINLSERPVKQKAPPAYWKGGCMNKSPLAVNQTGGMPRLRLA
jgi:hypothetical protein